MFLALHETDEQKEADYAYERALSSALLESVKEFGAERGLGAWGSLDRVQLIGAGTVLLNGTVLVEGKQEKATPREHWIVIVENESKRQTVHDLKLALDNFKKLHECTATITVVKPMTAGSQATEAGVPSGIRRA